MLWTKNSWKMLSCKLWEVKSSLTPAVFCTLWNDTTIRPRTWHLGLNLTLQLLTARQPSRNICVVCWSTEELHWQIFIGVLSSEMMPNSMPSFLFICRYSLISKTRNSYICFCHIISLTLRHSNVKYSHRSNLLFSKSYKDKGTLW